MFVYITTYEFIKRIFVLFAVMDRYVCVERERERGRERERERVNEYT